MKHRWALARLQWLNVEQGGITKSVWGRLRVPALFHRYPSCWWSLNIVLDKPVAAGDTVVAAINLIVPTMEEILLCEGETFELKAGPGTVALGEILSIFHVDKEDFLRVSQDGTLLPCEPKQKVKGE